MTAQRKLSTMTKNYQENGQIDFTQKLFEQVKPLLEKGFSYSGAVRKLKGLPKNHNFANMAWYKELLEYGESQGYPRKNHIRSKKNGM